MSSNFKWPEGRISALQFNTFAILIVGLATNVAFAQSSCSDTFNVPEFMTAPRNQAELDWCFAYAGADLVSAYVGEQVSASQIGIAHNATLKKQSDRLDLKRRELAGGGFADDAIRATLHLDQQFCRERAQPSNLSFSFKDDPKNRQTLFSERTLGQRLRRELRMDREKMSLPRSFEQFRNLDAHESMKALASIDSPDGDTQGTNRLQALSHANCTKDGLAPTFSIRDIKRESLTLERLHDVVSSGAVATVSLPVIPTIRDATETQKRRLPGILLQLAGGSHEMLLAGRRYNTVTRECEFIFKNSWGDVTRPEKRTVNGYTYIPESKLRQARMGAITTIDRPVHWQNGSLP